MFFGRMLNIGLNPLKYSDISIFCILAKLPEKEKYCNESATKSLPVSNRVNW